MSFRDIEQVLGFPLPPAARRHRPWWSNNGTNNVMTRAWLDAGFKTEQVDMMGEVLVFRKVGPAKPARLHSDVGSTPRLYGALRGTVRFADDFDPTEPTGETWNAEEGRL